MPDDRKVVKTVSSGVPALYAPVDVHDSTLKHIQEGHLEEFLRLSEVYRTIEDPDLVLLSKTKPDNGLILVNTNCASESGDCYLHVPIKTYKGQNSILSTAYFAEPGKKGKKIYKKKTPKKKHV